MPTDFRKAFKTFESLISVVNVDWQLFRDLHDPRAILTFHEAGRGFYHIVEQALLNQVVVGLGGLLDNETVCGRTNLSAKWILAQDEVSTFRGELEAILNPVLEKWQNGAATFRHKVLAHRDFNVFTEQAEYPDFVIRDLEEIAAGLWDFVRLIESRLYEVDVSRMVCVSEGLPHILRYLRLGLQAKKQGMILEQ